MRFRVRWSAFYRDASLCLCLCRIALLHEDASEIQPGSHKIGPEPKCGFEMIHRGLQFPSLPQDPTQGGLRLGVRGRAANCLFEIGTGGSEVALPESVLAPLIGDTRG